MITSFDQWPTYPPAHDPCPLAWPVKSLVTCLPCACMPSTVKGAAGYRPSTLREMSLLRDAASSHNTCNCRSVNCYHLLCFKRTVRTHHQWRMGFVDTTSSVCGMLLMEFTYLWRRQDCLIDTIHHGNSDIAVGKSHYFCKYCSTYVKAQAMVMANFCGGTKIHEIVKLSASKLTWCTVCSFSVHVLTEWEKYEIKY